MKNNAKSKTVKNVKKTNVKKQTENTKIAAIKSEFNDLQFEKEHNEPANSTNEFETAEHIENRQYEQQGPNNIGTGNTEQQGPNNIGIGNTEHDDITSVNSDTTEQNIQANEISENIVKTKRRRRTKAEILAERSKNETSETLNDEDFENLERELKKSKKSETSSESNGSIESQSPTNGLITGYIVLYVIDSIAPTLIAYILKRFHNINISVKSIKLTQEQFTTLEPFADELAKKLVLKLSAEWVFIIVLGLSYFENTAILIGKINNKK